MQRVMALAVALWAWECGVTVEWERSLAAYQRRKLADSGQPATNRKEFRGPLRITPVYLDLSGLEEEAVRALKEDVIPGVLQWFRNALSVYQVQGNLVLAQEECWTQAIPEEHRTVGVPQTDFILYIWAEADSGYNARGGTCAYDTSSSGNPIAGFYQINSDAYDSSISLSTAIAISRHEITHALVFTQGNFASFRQADGELYESLIVTEELRGVTRSVLQSPKVAAMAQSSFACGTLQGLELENQGASGTAGSHWKKRVMVNDYMVGVLQPPPIYSKVTLALFEDSGWYLPNYQYGEEVIYGKGEGCGFIEEKCISDGKASFSEFCDANNDRMCDFTQSMIARCNIDTYESELDSEYAYFADPLIGGGDKTMDYCPLAVGYSNGDCTNRISTQTEPPEYYGETWGINSRCFFSSLLRENYVPDGTTLAACYAVTCSDSAAAVHVGSTTMECPPEGGEIAEIAGFTGTLLCPPFSALCGRAITCPSACNGVGACLDSGTCQCNPGYYGNDCELTCPQACAKCSATECSQCDKNAVLRGQKCECRYGFRFDSATRECVPNIKACDPGCQSLSGAAAIDRIKQYSLFSASYTTDPRPYICYEYAIDHCSANSEFQLVLGRPVPDDIETLELTEEDCVELLYSEMLIAESWIIETLGTDICPASHAALVDIVHSAGVDEVAEWSAFREKVSGRVWGKAWTQQEVEEVWEELQQKQWCIDNAHRCSDDFDVLTESC